MRAAYDRNDITLYLGAGVSVGNGLPTWEQLVLAMYFSAISGETTAFANYLFAIAEWHLERTHEPLEITARKIRMHYGNQTQFMRELHHTLYAGFIDTPIEAGSGEEMRGGNPTLHTVARLCENSRPGHSGVRSVITYNYDDLLELALGDFPHQPIWRPTALRSRKLPIYHVHGYVPMGGGRGSTGREIVFTEEQYHQMAQDPYSWSNLVQIDAMSGSTGLMVGLSLTDRNMRRLLDAVVKAPLRSESYVVLQKPKWEEPDATALGEINAKAQQYLEKFQRSGAKGAGDWFVGLKGASWEDQVLRIIRDVEHFDIERQTSILEALGVHAIWYDEHAEVPEILGSIF